MSAKVARVHGDGDPRLVELDGVVRALEAELTPHLDQEEAELFPLLLSKDGGAAVETLLEAARTDHHWIGEQLARIRELTQEYALPVWACRSYRTLFAEREALETDVLRHVHLENHVLFPRVRG